MKLMEILSRIVVFIVLIIIGLIKGQRHVCLTKETLDQILILSCSVDRLTFSIDFYNPKGEIVGYCNPPVRRSFKCSSTKGDITQNLDTNTTTLSIKMLDNNKISGVWTCAHGSYTATISYLEKRPKTSCKSDNELGNIGIVFIVLFGITVMLNIYQCRAKHRLETKKKDLHRVPSAENTNETESLIPKDDELTAITANEYGNSTTDFDKCHTCNIPSTCVVCTTCKNMYCNICIKAHTKYYTDHKVRSFKHDLTCESAVKCQKCLTNKSVHICKPCKTVLCGRCASTHNHDETNLKEFDQELKEIRKKTQQCSLDEIEICQNLKIKKKNITIAGIAFLSDCIVALDQTNEKFIIFQDHDQVDKVIEGEPRAMAQMTNTKVAVTFCNEFEIGIFEIHDKKIYPKETIPLTQFKQKNLKPFSIAYDDQYFAVEVGEGDHGCIVVLHENGKLFKKINFPKDIVHFSGNTIRMALDMKKQQRIYVSVVSRKCFLCSDLDGKILWTRLLPDPRGIVAIPQGTKSGKNIIVCSKACSAVFRLDENEGTYDVLLAKGDVINPRYLAYNEEKRLLCIHVTNYTIDSPGEQHLLLYSYKDFPSDE